MFKNVFSERIKIERKKMGFTQEEVSNETGISRENISRYETGALEPNLENLAKLSIFYDESIDYLLGLGRPKQKTMESKTQNELLKDLEKTAKKDAKLAN